MRGLSTTGNSADNSETFSDAREENADAHAMMCLDRAGDTSQRCGHSPAFFISGSFQDPKNTPDVLTPYQLGQLIIDQGFSGDSYIATYLAERLNYSILLQYCRAIEADLLVDNTLDNMHDLLCFDRDLRTVMMKWIGVFEERFRAKVASETALELGAFAHLHPENFKDSEHYGKLMDSYVREVDQKVRSNDDAVLKALDQYGELPIWAAVEVLSFGSLSKLYRNLKSKSVQHAVADAFRVPYGALASWLRTLAEVRNRCAHSTPLVCKPVVIKPKKLPQIAADNGTVFYVALMLVKLTEDESIHADLRSTYELGMVADIVDLCKDKHSDILSIAGFPDDWATVVTQTSSAMKELEKLVKEEATKQEKGLDEI